MFKERVIKPSSTLLLRKRRTPRDSSGDNGDNAFPGFQIHSKFVAKFQKTIGPQFSVQLTVC